MIKAVFIDFYGTVVYEDGEIVSRISRIIFETGKAESIKQVDAYWWNSFRSLFENSYGENFTKQRELEIQSLKDTVAHFGSTADVERLSQEMFEYWIKPQIFEESKRFFTECPVPVYIVSNIDSADIMAAVNYHGLTPMDVFTSEDAKSYKPRKELFELALSRTGLSADEVIHIGDSLSSDIKGAYMAGIKALWINRQGKAVPDRVISITNLLEVFDYL